MDRGIIGGGEAASALVEKPAEAVHGLAPAAFEGFVPVARADGDVQEDGR